MQTYQTPHAIPNDLYRRLILCPQHGGLPHFRGRVHFRQQRGLGLASSLFSLAKNVVPRLITGKAGQIGKSVLKQMVPAVIDSVVSGGRDLATGRKKFKNVVKDTLKANRTKLADVAMKEVIRHAVQAPTRRPKIRKQAGKKKRQKGGTLMSTKGQSRLTKRNQKNPMTNYAYSDVFSQLS